MDTSFPGLGSNPRLQQTQKGSADDYSLQSCGRVTINWWIFHKVGLGWRRTPPPPVDQKWRLLKIFFFFFLSTDGIIGLMREHEQAWSQSRIWVPSHLFLPRLASWMYNLCSHTWPCAQQGLVLGLIV